MHTGSQEATLDTRIALPAKVGAALSFLIFILCLFRLIMSSSSSASLIFILIILFLLFLLHHILVLFLFIILPCPPVPPLFASLTRVKRGPLTYTSQAELVHLPAA